eukprot:1427494-Pyramimonas_sp.AAC.2
MLFQNTTIDPSEIGKDPLTHNITPTTKRPVCGGNRWLRCAVWAAQKRPRHPTKRRLFLQLETSRPTCTLDGHAVKMTWFVCGSITRPSALNPAW